MFLVQHTQTGETTIKYNSPYDALTEAELYCEWEDCEVELIEVHNGNGQPAEFPCAYAFHYGEEYYTCELTANRPDSLCPFHAGEED